MCRDIERLTLLTDVIISAIRSCYLPYLPHTPGHLQFFFFLGGLIRTPELLVDLMYVFFGYHAATNSCVMETAREMTRTSQNQRVVIFDLPHHLPPGQDRFRQFPNPRREKLDLSRGLSGGDGSRSN